MRGMLVVNHKATTTTDRTRDVLIHALADQFHLKIVYTDHRGHAMELGESAVRDNLNVLVVLGGDGTVNETVNGMMRARGNRNADELPRFGAVPGGSANVYTRALGFPVDPVEATGALVDAIRHDRTRTINMGHVNAQSEAGDTIDRWIVFNAGLGIDAEIIHAMEKLRASGKEASPARYLATTLRTFFLHTDRKQPHMRLEMPEQNVDNVFLVIIQNASPWTFLGGLPVNPLPGVDWDTGLGVWALRRMRFVDGVRYARRIVMHSSAGSTKQLYIAPDCHRFRAYASPPISLQVDGEGLGDITQATFTSHEESLRVFVS